jgi:hypothetical protein
MADIFGQDIKVDERMQVVTSANGEAVLTVGPETGVQDIRLRLYQYLGTLFYDKEYGSRVLDWVQDESTQESRASLVNEVIRRVRKDPRVKHGSVSGRMAAWDESTVQVDVSWEFIDDDHAYNLVVAVDSDKKEMVIKDVNPY